MGFCRLFEMEC